MKTLLPFPVAQSLTLQYSPAFLWVQQEPPLVWDTARPDPNRVQAVGTATKASGVEFGAWSATGTLLLGSAIATNGRCIVVHTV